MIGSPRRGRGGITLVEALLASVIVVTVFVPLMTTMVSNQGATVRLEDLVQFHGRALLVIDSAVRTDLGSLIAFSPPQLQTWAEDVVDGIPPLETKVTPVLSAVAGEPEQRILSVSVEWTSFEAEGRRTARRARLHRLLMAHRGTLTRGLGIE